MSIATNFMKLSLPFNSFRPNTAKVMPISQITTNSNNGASTLTKLLPWRLLAEVPSAPNYRPPSVSVSSLPPEVPEIPRTPELDLFHTLLEFTTSDPPPLGRPRPDPSPDFPKPPLGPPPTGPEVVPVPPPGRKPSPEVDPPPSTPQDYVRPPSIPPDSPTPRIPPDIPPTKGPSFVF